MTTNARPLWQIESLTIIKKETQHVNVTQEQEKSNGDNLILWDTWGKDCRTNGSQGLSSGGDGEEKEERELLLLKRP